MSIETDRLAADVRSLIADSDGRLGIGNAEIWDLLEDVAAAQARLFAEGTPAAEREAVAQILALRGIVRGRLSEEAQRWFGWAVGLAFEAAAAGLRRGMGGLE